MTEPRRSFSERLAAGSLVLDGGLATELESRGHGLGDSLWSARLLRDSPQDIEDVHRAYFDAGADVATTASYQATFEGFAGVGVGTEETRALLRRSSATVQGRRNVPFPPHARRCSAPSPAA